MSIQSHLYLYYSFIDILSFLYTFLIFLFNEKRDPTFGSLIFIDTTIYLDVIILLYKIKCCVLGVLFHICIPEVRVYCTGVPQSFSFNHKCYVDWRVEDCCTKWWAFKFLDYSGIIFIVLDLKFPHIYYCGLCVDNIWLCSQRKQSRTELVDY